MPLLTTAQARFLQGPYGRKDVSRSSYLCRSSASGSYTYLLPDDCFLTHGCCFPELQPVINVLSDRLWWVKDPLCLIISHYVWSSVGMSPEAFNSVKIRWIVIILILFVVKCDLDIILTATFAITRVRKSGNWCSMKWQHQSFFLSVVIGGTNRAQYLRLHSPLWPWGDPWEPQHQSRYVVSHKDTIVTTASWLYSAKLV